VRVRVRVNSSSSSESKFGRGGAPMVLGHREGGVYIRPLGTEPWLAPSAVMELKLQLKLYFQLQLMALFLKLILHHESPYNVVHRVCIGSSAATLQLRLAMQSVREGEMSLSHHLSDGHDPPPTTLPPWPRPPCPQLPRSLRPQQPPPYSAIMHLFR